MILPSVRAKLLAAFQTQLPTVDIRAVPPGENANLKESVWIQRISSTFDWRCLGSSPRNRTESLTCTVKVRVYREAPAADDAAEAAMARCEAILSSLEDAIEADFSLNSAFSFGLARSVDAQLVPAPAGWVADGTYVLEATNYPAA